MVERDVVGNAAWVRLDDRGIVVTGAAQGIGRAIARAMARAGARVLIADRNEEGAALAAEDIRAAGGRAWSLQVDVTVAEQVEAMIDAAVERLGRLDVLVNNAGIVRSGPLLECSERDWDDLFAVNTKAAFLCCRAAARRMVSSGGSIIIIASNCAGMPRVDLGAYCASKAAAAMLGKVLALELARYHIRVNVICPGSCDTEMQRSMWAKLGIGPEHQIAGDLARFRTGIPLGRLATPQDVAQAALFLASDAAGFITGQALYVDGGQTML